MQFTVVTTEAVAMWVCFDRKFIYTNGFCNIYKIFINNDCFGSGGGLSLRGDSCRSLIVRQNQFTNNSVRGGAGGALSMSLGRNCRTVLVEQNIFTTNSASSGGAVYYRESTLQTVPNNLSTDVLITDNAMCSLATQHLVVGLPLLVQTLGSQFKPHFSKRTD